MARIRNDLGSGLGWRCQLNGGFEQGSWKHTMAFNLVDKSKETLEYACPVTSRQLYISQFLLIVTPRRQKKASPLSWSNQNSARLSDSIALPEHLILS